MPLLAATYAIDFALQYVKDRWAFQVVYRIKLFLLYIFNMYWIVKFAICKICNVKGYIKVAQNSFEHLDFDGLIKSLFMT